jgi:hypothetical protein
MRTQSPLTDKQKSALGMMLFMAFKEIKILIWNDKAEQAQDLADSIGHLPYQMFSPEFEWQPYEKSLADYGQRYADVDGVKYTGCPYADFINQIRANE